MCLEKWEVLEVVLPGKGTNNLPYGKRVCRGTECRGKLYIITLFIIARIPSNNCLKSIASYHTRNAYF